MIFTTLIIESVKSDRILRDMICQKILQRLTLIRCFTSFSIAFCNSGLNFSSS